MVLPDLRATVVVREFFLKEKDLAFFYLNSAEKMNLQKNIISDDERIHK